MDDIMEKWNKFRDKNISEKMDNGFRKVKILFKISKKYVSPSEDDFKKFRENKIGEKIINFGAKGK